MRHTLATLAVMAQAALAQEDKANYEHFAAMVAKTGWNWEPYQVTTEDGWNLTLFRIFGDETDETKVPLVVQQGSQMIPNDWLASWVM